MSTPKEPCYSDKDLPFPSSPRTEAEYMRCFDGAGDQHSVIGEASSNYLYSKVAVPNILAFNPDARFIVMVRNPIDMAASLHAQSVKGLLEDVVDFGEAWQLQEERRAGRSLPRVCYQKEFVLYGDFCRLGWQLQHLYATVPRERVHVVVFDDLARDPRASYRGALRFLGLEDDHRTDFPIRNVNAEPRSQMLRVVGTHLLAWRSRIPVRKGLGVVSAITRFNAKPTVRASPPHDLRLQLSDYFRDDVALLSDLLGRDLATWLAAPAAEPANHGGSAVAAAEAKSARTPARTALANPGKDASLATFSSAFSLHEPGTRPQILFHHCPKTAGVSFLSFAEHAFLPQHVLLISNPRRLATDAFARQLARWDIRFIGGHIPPNCAVAGGPYARVSFVRDPERFLISQFCYAYQHRFDGANYRRFFAQRSGKDFFTADDIAAYFQDVEEDNLQTRFYADRPMGNLTRRDLNEAISALNAMAFVGTQDNMQASMDAFRSIFNIGHREFWHHNSSDAGIVKIAPRERLELAKRLMPYDYELYQNGLAVSLAHQRSVAHMTPPGGATIFIPRDRLRSMRGWLYSAARKDLTEWRTAFTVRTRRLVGAARPTGDQPVRRA